MKRRRDRFFGASISLASVFAGLGFLAGAAYAAPPACSDATGAVGDCLAGDVLVIRGDDLGFKACQASNVVSFLSNKLQTTCVLPGEPAALARSYYQIESRVRGLLGSDAHWDQLVLLTADFSTGTFRADSTKKLGAAFYRLEGTNEVANIGLPLKPRGALPYVGIVGMGDTTSFGTYQPPRADPPLGSAFYLTGWPDPDPAGVASLGNGFFPCDSQQSCPGMPFPDLFQVYNGYQVMALVTGSMYAPYFSPGDWNGPGMPGPVCSGGTVVLGGGQDAGVTPPAQGGPDAGAPASTVDAGTAPSDAGAAGFIRATVTDNNCYPLSVLPPSSGGSTATSVNDLPGVNLRTWNSFLDLDGSLLGGVNWRDNGNGTVQNDDATAYWLASPPYQGSRILRFHPFELYAMGFLPPERVTPVDRYTFSVQQAMPNRNGQSAGIDGTGKAVFASGGTRMWLNKPGTGFFRVDATRDTLSIDTVTQANGGPRSPSFNEAPHHIRQLWVLVTKPAISDSPDQLAPAKEVNKRVLNLVRRWRVQWPQYFHMLTGYTGRVTTSYDGATDETGNWDFGQPSDDQLAWKTNGDITAEFRLPEAATPPTPAIDTRVVIKHTAGEGASLKYTPAAPRVLPIRIKVDAFDASKYDPDPKKDRRRDDSDAPGAANTVTLRMRIAAGTAPQGAHARVIANGHAITIPANDNSGLIGDGDWHTYSALLNDPAVAGTVITSLELIPSDKPYDGVMDIDFLRFERADPYRTADGDVDCAGQPAPDGFVDVYDNCPSLYNPDQADKDRNGIGDACEDFDGDSISNACDNCPTITNIRQSDRDNDKIGDACDSGKDSGCFLAPDSFGGRVTGARGPFVLGAVGLGLLLVIRRRSRRR